MILALIALLATSYSPLAPIVAQGESLQAGPIVIRCAEPRGWTFSTTAALDAGRDAVTIRLVSPTHAVPPQFGVFWRVSGAGVQNVWTSHYKRDGYHLWPELWWGGQTRYRSQLAADTPIAVGFNSEGRAPVALACSEAFEAVDFALCVDEKTGDLIARCEFFTQPTTARTHYEVTVLMDRRNGAWDDTVRDCTRWIAAHNHLTPAPVPEAAFDPVYSTWYGFLQDIHAPELEAEAKRAAVLGMKTLIIDDGWQKENSQCFYSATGDWQPARRRFPDMRAHVAALHAAGVRAMLWMAVPFMGSEAANAPRFQKMLLTDGEVGVMDPRFPAVRDYLVETCVRIVRDWDFDGLKLDFIDSFVLPAKDPALADDFAGRDYRSLPEAVDCLMKTILARVRAVKPEALIEFRQSYIGTPILQYGNMIRACDCPADPLANRRRICDLRLTSGQAAVHSDMLVWSADETPAGAALPILNVLFSTIQYSLVLAKINPAHEAVIRHWLAFSQAHRAALLKGAFHPHNPELSYPWVEGATAQERIVAVYARDICARIATADRPAYIINATREQGTLVALPQMPRAVTLVDTFGHETPWSVPGGEAGLLSLPIPEAGYARIDF